MKKNFHILFLVFLSSAIALSPSFVVGKISGEREIEIRLEDILIVFLGFFWIAEFLIFKIKRIKKPPLLLPILAWLGIGLLSVLTNWVFFAFSLSRGFFYFLKEIEFFFLYFYFFYHLKKINDVKFLLNIWIVLAVINAGYIFYQIILKTGLGEYGAGAIGEWGAFPSGSFFLLLFIFLVNIFAYYYLSLDTSFFKKAVLGVFVFLPAVGVFSSASKTSFLALIFSFSLFIILLLIKKRSFKLLFLCVLTVLLLIFLLNLVLNNIVRTGRLTDVFSFGGIFESFYRGRILILNPFLQEIYDNPWYYYLIGQGKGFLHEAHNQFLRNFIEVGLIGEFIFIFLILQIITISGWSFLKSREPLKIGLSSGVLLATLTMLFFSFATEPFIVVKLSEVYWVFVAIAMAGLSL